MRQSRRSLRKLGGEWLATCITALAMPLDSSLKSTDRKSDQLRRIVALHDVVYEVRAHEEVVKFRSESKLVRNGFDLTLCGTHSHGHSTMTPGCRHCVDTYQDLEAIARWIMPSEERASFYDISGFDRALHSVRTPSRRLEVNLTVRIKHRQGWAEPIDECERRCLKEMEGNLKALGVRRR